MCSAYAHFYEDINIILDQDARRRDERVIVAADVLPFLSSLFFLSNCFFLLPFFLFQPFYMSDRKPCAFLVIRPISILSYLC